MAAWVFRNELSPFVFQVEAFGREIGLRWYALAYLLGFAIGYFALRRASERLKLSKDDVDTLMFSLMIGVIAGGRLGYCVQKPDRLLSDPLFLFRLNEGGMAFFGGVVGVLVAVIWFGRSRKLEWTELGDTLAVPAAISLGLGRLANFVNAELWGVPTEADWGVIYPAVDAQLRHPYELYAAASHFLLALVLWGVARARPSLPSGTLAGLFVLGYGLLRLGTDVFRESEVFLGPINHNQVASLILALAGGAFLFAHMRKIRAANG